MPAGKGKGSPANPVSLLSGSKLSLDVRESDTSSLSTFATTQSSLTHVEDTITIYKEIVPVKFRGKSLNINTGFKLLDWKPTSSTPNEGVLTLQNNAGTTTVKAYQKTIPLQDPYGWMKHNVQPVLPFAWSLQNPDVLAPENQGYVDATACALVSKLHTLSPHFCKLYGVFRAVKDVFRYNLEDDIEDFRFSKWFWSAIDSGIFGISITEKKSGRVLSQEEVHQMIRPDPEFLSDDDSDTENDTSCDGTNSTTSLGAESLDVETTNEEVSNTGILEDASTVEFPEVFEPVVEARKRRNSISMETASSISTSSSSSSFSEEYNVHAEFKSMPVVVIYLEHLENTMDSLLEDHVSSPIKVCDDSSRWTAWLFQVCAALSQLQTVFHLTHNDLHTNNILWKSTDIEYLWYKNGRGQVWRVPTFGKVFCLIDYGRAIYNLNGHTCISSDYDDGHDASGMYNFGPIEDRSERHVGPNMSFDLCRLSCSLIRALYPNNPDGLPTGQVLTKEGMWIVKETGHSLFNLLWTWLRMKDMSNVLETEHGKERFPGFELYAVIASEVRDAVPEKQLNHAAFKPLLHTGAVGTSACIPL